MAPVIVTGAAGFIGMHLSERLLARGEDVVGIDAITAYYDPALKRARLDRLQRYPGFKSYETDLADPDATARVFEDVRPDRVVHLAAQPGVRASIDDPITSIRANCDGFVTVLEAGRRHGLAHLVYASSSSVYGANRTLPYSTEHSVNHPVSLYAASKKANELMAHTFAHVHKLPVTGLRFFTVYGPWGRPDMAAYLFTRAIFANQPIKIFNNGDMWRDFTYVDDIVEGVIRTLDRPATPNPAWNAEQPENSTSYAPYRVYNIGNNRSVKLIEFVETLEKIIGKPAIRELLPMQAGDVLETRADISALQRDVGFAPSTPIAEGLARFVEWYRKYHGV
ncbi:MULTISPECIES: NAD-dependent epimerase/dehydratase family protein [unclassified Bradyrhizobium]|uniref:NAD-dependent epimerase/dehydratase family protein n=1 Tax=unclassified Bradyrhizobium TaxID=2631580 RepID=UPI0021185AF9|nr:MULTISPECIES: NAD-dependent epimerase/dehydratase family protein [unclassified Bradyrhizobium]